MPQITKFHSDRSPPIKPSVYTLSAFGRKRKSWTKYCVFPLVMLIVGSFSENLKPKSNR
ncbi:hypothetical protein HanIR_Chr02g0062921 [Helianthus annuus]|nr:hypothetical protein HanIR_Chr02g0062921 [Helianthus annuus]